MNRIKTYLSNLAWAADVLLNALTGGGRETISARLGRGKLRENPVAIAVCRVLDHMDPSHCTDSARWWEHAHSEAHDEGEGKNHGA